MKIHYNLEMLNKMHQIYSGAFFIELQNYEKFQVKIQ